MDNGNVWLNDLLPAGVPCTGLTGTFQLSHSVSYIWDVEKWNSRAKLWDVVAVFKTQFEAQEYLDSLLHRNLECR